MIKVNNIHHSYGNLKVLEGINFNINKGDFVSIVGSSGAGKTTLLHLIGTLDKIQKGEIEINGKIINNLSDKNLAIFRNQEIGFIFQFHNLLQEFTALENIYLPALIYGESLNIAEKKAIEILKILNLQNRSNHKPNELSGGEKQKIAVARALINKPSIILADEPTGNLDSKNSDELYKLFLRLNSELEQTFLIITHNPTLSNLADYKLKIKDGKII
tara:strand:+ start:570 stop:1220 length:651 start_codon:yes stop_codon:yes gene_type:complete